VKVQGGGVQFHERNERKKIFDPPPLAYLGDMKQEFAVFFTAIMTSDLD